MGVDPDAVDRRGGNEPVAMVRVPLRDRGVASDGYLPPPLSTGSVRKMILKSVLRAHVVT